MNVNIRKKNYVNYEQKELRDDSAYAGIINVNFVLWVKFKLAQTRILLTCGIVREEIARSDTCPLSCLGVFLQVVCSATFYHWEDI